MCELSAFRPVFQFHKGTIKTDICREIKTALLHFNSIKVQLKRQSSEESRRSQPISIP